MINKFLHIGFENYVNHEEVYLISDCDTDRLRRELKRKNIEKNSEGFWNACGNKEVRSIVVMKNGTIIASALKSETLVSRYVEMTKGGFVK